MLKKWQHNIFVIMVLVNLIGCNQIGKQISPTPTRINPDEILKLIKMSEDFCEPPCWMGIIPRETNYEEALEIVEGLEFFTDDGFVRILDDPLIINWHGGSGNMAFILFEDEIVSSVDFTDKSTTLGDVIHFFGVPDYYTVSEDEGGYGIDVFYPQAGIVFTSFQSSPNPLSESMQIWAIFFMPPGTRENFLMNYISVINTNRDIDIDYREEYYPWEGYGVCPQGLSSDEYCED